MKWSPAPAFKLQLQEMSTRRQHSLIYSRIPAAAAAKSRRSCPTLCDPKEGSPPSSHPWDSPGKNTGVGCHFLLQCMKVKSESEGAQPYPTLRNPMDCSPPGSSVHGISQARALGWGATAFSARIPRARRILEKIMFLSCRLEAGVPNNGTHSFFPLNPPTRGKCQAIPIVRCKGCCFFLLRKGTAKEGWHWQPHREGRGDQLTFQLSLSLSAHGDHCFLLG